MILYEDNLSVKFKWERVYHDFLKVLTGLIIVQQKVPDSCIDLTKKYCFLIFSWKSSKYIFRCFSLTGFAAAELRRRQQDCSAEGPRGLRDGQPRTPHHRARLQQYPHRLMINIYCIRWIKAKGFYRFCHQPFSKLTFVKLFKFTDRPVQEIVALLSCLVFQQKKCSDPGKRINSKLYFIFTFTISLLLGSFPDIIYNKLSLNIKKIQPIVENKFMESGNKSFS